MREEMHMQAILEPQSLAEASLQDLIGEMLVRLGEDPERDGLQNTPERMERSMQYLTGGYRENPAEVLLSAMFDVAYDEMVIVKDTTFCRSLARCTSHTYRTGRSLGSARFLAWWTCLPGDCRCKSV